MFEGKKKIALVKIIVNRRAIIEAQTKEYNSQKNS